MLPRVNVKDIEDLTEENVTLTLKRAINFYSTLQTHDGHWAGDYGGPMFLLPGLVSHFIIQTTYFFRDEYIGDSLSLVENNYSCFCNSVI